MTENCGYSHVVGQASSSRAGSGRTAQVLRAVAEDGEVLVRSGATMQGYYKDPKTAETMTADGYLRTGDKGEQDAQGNLRLTGRIKEIFKPAKASTSRRHRLRTAWANIRALSRCAWWAMVRPAHGLVRALRCGRNEAVNGGRGELQSSLEALLGRSTRTSTSMSGCSVWSWLATSGGGQRLPYANPENQTCGIGRLR